MSCVRRATWSWQTERRACSAACRVWWPRLQAAPPGPYDTLRSSRTAVSPVCVRPCARADTLSHGRPAGRLRWSVRTRKRREAACYTAAARALAAQRARAMFSLLYGLYEHLFRKARSAGCGCGVVALTPAFPSAQAEIRLLLVGLDKAGKTSCLEKLRALQLAPPDSGAAASAAAAVQLPVSPTVGLNIARFELAGTKLTLWDLGGQARGAWARVCATASCGPVHAASDALARNRRACAAFGRSTTPTRTR